MIRGSEEERFVGVERPAPGGSPSGEPQAFTPTQYL